jgi:type V secretory pathway adhesin AidA
MVTRVVLAGLLIFAAGCARKPPKTAPTKDTAPPPGGAGTAAKGQDAKDLAAKSSEKPNWINDPRLKANDAPAAPVAAASGIPGKPGLGFTVPGGYADQPAARPAGPTPTTSSQPSPGVNAAVSEADMKDVWVYIENASGASGSMPSPGSIQEALELAGSPAAKLVKDRAIVLTGATMRDSIWAHEAAALTKGGLAASQNGVERLTADELARRLKSR